MGRKDANLAVDSIELQPQVRSRNSTSSTRYMEGTEVTASENPYDERLTENEDVDYYPDVSHHGRHTAIPTFDDSVEDDFSIQKDSGWRERLQKYIHGGKIKLLIVIGAGMITVCLLAYTLIAYGGDSESSNENSTHDSTGLIGGISSGSEKVNKYKDDSSFVSLTPAFGESDLLMKKNLTMQDFRMGMYYPFEFDTEFVDVDGSGIKARSESDKANAENTDSGFYIHRSGSVWVLKKANDSSFEKKFLDTKSIKFEDKGVYVGLVSVDKNLKRALVYSDFESGFRHSSKAKYWIVDLDSLKPEPVYKLENGHVAKLSYATTSPDFNYVTFVYESNVYIRDLRQKSVLSVTQDGSNDIFNGKPDWVYEEEVLGTGNTIWWCPDESKFAFLTLNDTQVDDYQLEFFKDLKYPQIERIKYPKAGEKNPIASIHVYDVQQGIVSTVGHDGSKLGDDYLVYSMNWITGNELLVKETDRTSRTVDMRLYDVENDVSKIVRTINTAEYGGWYYGSDIKGRIFSVPHDPGYIDDIVVNNHSRLAYFASSTSTKPQNVLGGTSGNWETIGGVVGYNKEKRLVYFIGTGGSSVQRIIYEAKLDGDGGFRAFSDTDKIENYQVKFSSSAQYALLKYEGPNFPWQRVVDVAKWFGVDQEQYRNDKSDFHESKEVYDAMRDYSAPTKTFEKIKMDDGTEIEMVEVRPAAFDVQKKYPLLVSVYGGPGLQKLQCSFNYGFEEVVSSSLGAVILYIDPRGTGGRDWRFQSYARDKLGYWEPRDVTSAVKKVIESRGYIDADRTAVWGWSYGGFTTLKTLEYDKGSTFKYGMAVAPVTDWKLYDSVYSERYMGLPSKNANYDSTSRVVDVESFKTVKRFLIMHGTGDDNVHVQNTYRLLDRFNIQSVENYDMRIFPDSDHNINYHNAYKIVFDKLYDWLDRAFRGEYANF